MQHRMHTFSPCFDFAPYLDIPLINQDPKPLQPANTHKHFRSKVVADCHEGIRMMSHWIYFSQKIISLHSEQNLQEKIGFPHNIIREQWLSVWCEANLAIHNTENVTSLELLFGWERTASHCYLKYKGHAPSEVKCDVPTTTFFKLKWGSNL